MFSRSDLDEQIDNRRSKNVGVEHLTPRGTRRDDAAST
jgi:hypothetical protein